MMPTPDAPLVPTAPRPILPRTDGEASRQRLMQAGLRLFAHKGFAPTSIRELARAAGVNVAAISYYFGDKAGLYRAVFFAPCGNADEDVARVSDPCLSLADALDGFFLPFLDPMCLAEEGRLGVKLRMREMLEPTGLLAQEIREGIQPMHDALVGVLCRHLALAGPDSDIHRLAVCISAMPIHLHMARDVIDAVAPQLNQAPDAVAQWRRCLRLQALAMVAAELDRRQAASHSTLTDQPDTTSPPLPIACP